VADAVTAGGVSRSAFLELRDEEQLVRTGYEFLDEKRVQLAAEILRQRARYREVRQIFADAAKRASAVLLEAAAAYGLEALQLSDAEPIDTAQLEKTVAMFVGVPLLEVGLRTAGEQPAAATPRAPGLIEDCADAFREVLHIGVRLAGLSANLERLLAEYERTERRVRALENVILPELRSDLAIMEEHLDLNEQEEVIRVRSARARGDAP